jgi:ATP synthase protein I
MSQPNNRWMIKAAPVWSIPFLIPISIAIGLGLGLYLDSKLGTKPWLAVVFTVLGLVSGLYESIRILVEVNRDTER